MTNEYIPFKSVNLTLNVPYLNISMQRLHQPQDQIQTNMAKISS